MQTNTWTTSTGHGPARDGDAHRLQQTGMSAASGRRSQKHRTAARREHHTGGPEVGLVHQFHLGASGEAVSERLTEDTAGQRRRNCTARKINEPKGKAGKINQTSLQTTQTGVEGEKSRLLRELVEAGWDVVDKLTRALSGCHGPKAHVLLKGEEAGIQSFAIARERKKKGAASQLEPNWRKAT